MAEPLSIDLRKRRGRADAQPLSSHAQGLGRALVKGDTPKATLTFQHAGNLPVEFSIAGVGAMEPSGGDASAGDGMMDMKMK